MRMQHDQDTPQELPAGDESNRVLELIDTAIKVSKGLDAAGARALEARETMHNRTEHARVSLGGAEREPRLLASRKKRKEKHHGKRKVSFFHYSYYDVAFKFFIEQVLDAEWTPVPPRTKRTIEIGSRYSTDYVCTPFKHILGDYIEALEAGADVLIQTAGPCRLGYYGELHESILRDLGYEFDCLNFAYLAGKGIDEYVKAVKKINPNLSVKKGVRKLLSLAKMITDLDEAYDYYLAHAGAELEKGAFDRALSAYHDEMRHATNDSAIALAHQHGMDAMRSIPCRQGERIRIGIVGEFFTAVDQESNLNTEHRLLDMGVELHRTVNLTNRYLSYSEPNLRVGVREYLAYDDGPTSTLTISAAKKYAELGYDGIIHIKSAGCTPEIDCMPILQQVSSDYHIPILYLSFDSQTSDTGLDTRLEAFYDMLAMKKGKVLA